MFKEPEYCCQDLKATVNKEKLDLHSMNTYSQSGLRISTDYYFLRDNGKVVDICPYCGVDIKKISTIEVCEV